MRNITVRDAQIRTLWTSPAHFATREWRIQVALGYDQMNPPLKLPKEPLMTAIRSIASPKVVFWSSILVIASVYVLGVLIVSPLFAQFLGPLAQAYSLSLALFAIVLVGAARFVFRYLASARGIEWVEELPAAYERLAVSMRVRPFIKKYGEPASLLNAFADPFRGRLVVGGKLGARLTPNQTLAVVAHELAHLRQMRGWPAALIGGLYGLLFLSITNLFGGWHPIIGLPPVVAIEILLICALRWRMEYDADRNAANYVDPNDIADALEALEPDLAKRSVPSPFHPPLSWRVKRLRRLIRKIGESGWAPT